MQRNRGFGFVHGAKFANIALTTIGVVSDGSKIARNAVRSMKQAGIAGRRVDSYENTQLAASTIVAQTGLLQVLTEHG